MYLERALFVIGFPDDGKSTNLRHIFLDKRLSKDGKIPTQNNPPSVYNISNERLLYLKLTSPHENPSGENKDLNAFINNLKNKFLAQPNKRWNFVCPLQPYKRNEMPHSQEIIEAFIKEFNPARVRVAILSPNIEGERKLTQEEITTLVEILARTDQRIEIMVLDARLGHSHKDSISKSNGLILADYFDFT